MKMDVRMPRQPIVALFMGAVVVHDHVQFLIGRGFRHDLIHKLKELLAPLELGDGRLDLSSSDLQGGKQIERAVAFIGAFETPHDFAIVRFDITLQRLFE